MAIQDTPVTTGPNKIQDQPIANTQVVTAKSQQRDSFEATQAAFLDNYLTGSGILENYSYYAGATDKEKELRRLSIEKSSQDAEVLSEEFVVDPYGGLGSIEENAEAVFRARTAAVERAQDPDTQFAESLVGGEVDPEEIDRQGYRAKMFKILSDWEDEVGITDVIMDIGKEIIPGVTAYRSVQTTGSYFGSDDAIKAAIAKFQTLPEEEQARIFPDLVEDLKENAGPVAGLQIANNLLQPFGAEEDQPFDTVDGVFDTIDALGFTAVLGAALKGLKGSYNVAKSAKQLGNDDVAIQTSVAAATDEELARAAGMDSVTGTGNILPFDTSIEDIGHTGGLSGKTLNSLREFFGEVDRTAEDIITGNGFLKEGIVNTKRRAELEAEAQNMLKAEQAENIRIVRKDENETVFEYEILDEDGNITTEKYNLGLTLNDAGYWEQSEMSLIGEYLGSPTAWAKGTLREDVDTAQRIDYLSSKINKQLTDVMRKAIQPVGLIPTPKNRASLAKVDKALREGDEWKNADGTRGTVFSPDDLREKFQMEENEINAYYRINRIYNNLFNIRNHEKRQEMVALGYKNVNLERSGEAVAGKVFETSNDAANSLRQRQTNYIYDADADEMISVRDQGEGFYKELYDNDKRIVRMEEPYDAGEGRGKVFYAMVSSDAVSDLPQVVLQRKVGYVPRVYENNAYFVKEITDSVVDGDKTYRNRKTLRFFDNKKDADTFVEELVQRAMREDGLTEKQARDKYKALADREEEILSAATGDIGHGSGGLYTGARAQDDILFGLEGTKPIRLNSFEALTRNIGNIAKFASVNQWRLGLEQRWINTANEIFKAKGLDRRVEGFDRLPTISEASDEVRFLNRMYDQIRDWQGFPTAEERAWDATMQKIYDWAANRGYKRTQKFVGNLKGTDPIATARATAFHSLLGWYNPAQLWVQAQGAMVAASLAGGKYLTRVLNNGLAFHMLDAGGNIMNKTAKTLAKAAGTTEDELLKMHELWKKTGYRDSVLQTADHAAASKGYGMSSALLRRAADTGLIFYRNGELVNRRMSFLTAVERWKERTGKPIDMIDDDTLKTIMDDANNMMLNMGRANRANWQKGILSLPTQFLQVTTKFLETAGGFNKNFTPAERGRLMASQLILYGTAGVPLAGLGTKFAMETMGITQQDIENNPGIVKAWNDGFWGATTYWIMGADIEVASRGSLLRGVSDTIDNWFVQESAIQEKLLGAFGSTATRFWDSLTYNMKPFMLSEYEADWEDAGRLLISPFLDTVSTWRNQEKAAFMEKMDAIYSRNGRLLDTRDYSWTEELAQRIGFQPTVAAETWDLIQRTEANESSERKTVDYILNEMNEFALKYPDGNYPQAAFEQQQLKLSAAIASLDPDQQASARQSIMQSMQSGSRRAQALQRYMRTLKEKSADELSLWGSTILGNKVLRLGLETEEE